MKILICEDEVGVVTIMKKYLKLKGFAADHALNGKIALELIKSHDYELVFLDINMPELNGIEVLKYMKESYNKAKVVILTGYPGVNNDFCASLGADKFLQKPIDLKVIGDVIDEYSR